MGSTSTLAALIRAWSLSACRELVLNLAKPSSMRFVFLIV